MKFSKQETLEIVNDEHNDFEHIHEEALDLDFQPYARLLIVNHKRTNTYWQLCYENHPEYGIEIHSNELTQVYKVISVYYVSEISPAGSEIVEDDYEA